MIMVVTVMILMMVCDSILYCGNVMMEVVRWQ